MKLRILALLLPLACSFAALADEKPVSETSRTYVSSNVLAIPFGSFQVALEAPIDKDTSILLEGQYTNFEYGFANQLLFGLMDSLMDFNGLYGDETFSYSEMMKQFSFVGGGGSLGVLTYFEKSTQFFPYWSASASYYYYRYGVDMSGFGSDPSMESLPTIDMPIHMGTVIGSIGAKIPMGRFTAFDIFFSLGVNGMYMNMDAMLNSIGIDTSDYMNPTQYMFLTLGSVTLIPSSGFGFKFCLSF